MKYFSTLPSISQSDFNGKYLTTTNLLARAYLLQQLQNNLYLYYDYSIKDHDKPETIAYKFYNDQYRYWMIFYANGIMDPLSEWPLDHYNFYLYLSDKYKDEANTANMDPVTYTRATIHHYEQSITTYNDVDMVKSKVTIQIDKPTYDSIVPNTISNMLPDNSTVYKEIDKKVVYLFDYEYDLNEKKRNIKLIKDTYAIQMDSQLSSVMS